MSDEYRNSFLGNIEEILKDIRYILSLQIKHHLIFEKLNKHEQKFIDNCIKWVNIWG